MKGKLTTGIESSANRDTKHRTTAFNFAFSAARGPWPMAYCLPIIIFGLLLNSCSRNKEQASQSEYTCPMHPEIIRDKPGTCPICFMDLVKEGASPGEDGSLTLSESQIKLANVSTIPALKKEMEIETALNGKIVADEEQTEIVSSRVPGRIERLFFKETGQRVVKGEPLYEIYSEQLLTLQQEFLLAQRQVEELKEDRYESFLKASEKKLLLFGMTRDQIDALSSQKKADSRIIILAPTFGITVRIGVTEGQYVSEGSILYRIEKFDKVWVEAELYSGETALVKMGDQVKVRINGFENGLVQGSVIFLSPEFRQGNQVVTLRVEIDNPERKFIPGMQANVILSRSGENTIVLPLDAVVRDNTGSRIWVKEADGSFKMRRVTTGEENADEIEIVEGLQEKENVVVTGAYLLYSELVMKKGLNHHQHI